MVTYKLGICDKLNWNTVLISFNLFSLDFVLTTTGTFSETPQESLNNRGS